MRTTIITIMLFFSCISVAQFQFEDGPWYAARVRDIAVGYKNGLSVIYAVNMSESFITRTLVKSTDGGETWQHIPAIQNPISVATRRDNPDVVFVSTNDVGILKSTDGGTNWTVVYPGFVARRIAIARSNPNFVFAGSYLPYENPPYNSHSLHFSNDGGNTWGVDPSFEFLTSVTSIVFHPSQATFYVSGASLGAGAPQKGIWRNYLRVSEGLPNEQIAIVAIQEDNPSILYAGTIAGYGEQEPGEFRNNVYQSEPPHIYKSTDGGNTWTTRGNFYASGIAIDPTNSLNVFVSSDQGMMRSTDAGINWSESTAGLYDRNLLSLAADNSRGGAVFAGAFHSLYRTMDAGSSWTEQTHGIERPPVTSITVQNGRVVACADRTKYGGFHDLWVGTLHRRLNLQEPWLTTFANSNTSTDIYRWNDIKVHPNRSEAIYSVGTYGDQENGRVFKSTDDGETWSNLFQTGDQTELTSLDFDATDPNVLFVAGLQGFVIKSTDGGLNWTYLDPSMFAIQSLLLDPTTTGNNRVIYVAGSGIRKSNDDGNLWYDANNGIGEARSLAINPVHPLVLYGGNANGVYKTVDGGDRWQETNNGIVYRNVTSLLVHPNTPEIVYVSAAEGDILNPDLLHVYKTTNGGQEWREVSKSEGLPLHASLYKLSFDAANPNVLYAATDTGVYSIPHIWTGELATNATWKSGNTYLVEGTLTVPSGKTLTIDPGAIVKPLSNAKIQVNGELFAEGTSGSHITFSSYNPAEQWQGIDATSSSSVVLSYVTIEHTNIAVAVGMQTALNMENCTITDAAIGVQIIPVAEQPEVSKEILSCMLSEITNVGIYVESFSDLTIQGTTILGINQDKTGIELRYSSPTLLNNTIENFDVGLYCGTNSSPVLQDGYNKIQNNNIGVQCVDGADPMLGLAQLTPGGMNSIFGNSVWDVEITHKGSIVWAQGNWWGTPDDPVRQFKIANKSELLYDPWFSYDPNGDATNIAGKQQGSSNGGEEIQSLRPLIMRQVLAARLGNRHGEAMSLLRSIIADASMSVEVKQWAVDSYWQSHKDNQLRPSVHTL